jgi:hypothetical protein
MLLLLHALLNLAFRLQGSCVTNGMTVTQFTDALVPLFLNFSSVVVERLLIQCTSTRFHEISVA